MSYAPNGPPYLHLLLRSSAGPSGLERAGLWLIGVGAVIAIVALLFGGHLAGLTGRPVGAVGTRKDRAVYAATAAGASLVAVGSVFVAIKAFPAWCVVVLTALGAVVLVWLFAAWRLRVDSKEGRADAQRWIEQDQNRPAQIPATEPVGRREWDLRRYERQMTWRWYLRHAFSSERRAARDAEQHMGPRP